MQITKTANRDVRCDLDTEAADGFKGVIIIEREATGPVRKRMNRKWSHDAVSLSSVEFTKAVKCGVGALQYSQMAEIIAAISAEVQRRNSIGVNLYTPQIDLASAVLIEISGGEIGNFTSEHGPREVKA